MLNDAALPNARIMSADVEAVVVDLALQNLVAQVDHNPGSLSTPTPGVHERVVVASRPLRVRLGVGVDDDVDGTVGPVEE